MHSGFVDAFSAAGLSCPGAELDLTTHHPTRPTGFLNLLATVKRRSAMWTHRTARLTAPSAKETGAHSTIGEEADAMPLRSNPWNSSTGQSAVRVLIGSPPLESQER